MGTWRPGAPRFDIASDPIDGTSNIAAGLPNSISVMAASQRPEGAAHSMVNLPAFYSEKLAFGLEVVAAIEAGMDPLDLEFGCSVRADLGVGCEGIGEAGAGVGGDDNESSASCEDYR